MRKIRIELPKYRLQLDVKLVKRRKPLLDEPILPTPSIVRRKYRKGTFAARFVRYLVDHKNTKGVFAGVFAFVAITAIFIPQASSAEAEGVANVIIESQTNLATEKGMEYPVEVIRINQNYAFFHQGLDLGGKTGDIITPIMPGVVAYAGWDRSGYGNLVVLEHKNGIDSYYAHLSKITVKTGQAVDTNVVVGLMGATGRATGTHLHLEIHQNGVSLSPLTVLSK